MDIEFVCEHCGKLLKVGGYLAGQSTECYYCHQQVTVPNEGQKAVIEFECLGCGSKFRVPATRAGSRTKCPKCQALLVVPQPGAASVSSQTIAESQDIAPRAPGVAARPAAAPRGRPPVPGDQTPFALPSRIKLGADGQPMKAKAVPMGMIVFWIAIGTLLIVGLIMLAMSGGGATGSAPDSIIAEIKVNTAGFLMLVQRDPGDWTGVHVTLVTSAGNFTTEIPVLPPSKDTLLNFNQFSGPRGQFSQEMGTVKQIIVDVDKIPNGHKGQYMVSVGGPRAPVKPGSN